MNAPTGKDDQMSTASTQFEDERRMEFMMNKRHREAAMEARIREAGLARSSSLASILSAAGTLTASLVVRARMVMPRRSPRPRPAQGRP